MLKRWLMRARAGAEARSAPPRDPSPDAADAQFAEGCALLRARRFAEAEALLARAVAARPDWAAARHQLGCAYFEQSKLEDAEDELLIAVQQDPQLAGAHVQLGLTAYLRGRPEDAAVHFTDALALAPQSAAAHNGLGAIEMRRGRLDAAIDAFTRAVECDPAFGLAHSNLGYLLLGERDDPERGIAHLERAHALAPHEPGVRCNYSMALIYAGRLPEAIALCDGVLAEKPAMAVARLNRGLARLKLGQYAEGWDDYEARKTAHASYVPRDYGLPEWRGEALAGRRILVHGEQGLGDEIMFANCLPDVVARAAHCLIDCNPALVPLYRRSFPSAQVRAADGSTGWLAGAGGADCVAAIGSLPRVLRRSEAEFPAHHGYLRADPQRVAAWRTRVNALGRGLKIGVSWRGGLRSTHAGLRSLGLEVWLPVLQQAGVVAVSLQYGAIDEELSGLVQRHGVTLTHWPEAIADYDETAALVSALDLVVSVCTSVVHLAGALGQPTWVLVPAVAGWRYLAEGSRLPWYPAVEMFRQADGAGWAPVMDTVASRLRQRLAARGT